MGSEMTEWQNYESFKAELDGELQKTAEGFVRIGYLLKVARDTNVLTSSGYKTVTEFASAEYGLDKTQVSRFISINDRFSEGGYSDRLVDKYQGFGYAKLTIMLQIPEEITQELTPNYTKAEIQAVKEELDEERKVSDLEVMMEGRQEEETDVMWMTLKQLGHDDPNLWEKMWQQWKKTPFLGADETAAIMAPSGDKNYSVRIMGKGRVMLIMKDGEDAVTITNTRTMEKEVYTKQQMANLWCLLLHADAETAAEAWQKMYLEPWPKAEVAPVQQEPKKESKVQKAKKEEPKKPKKPKRTSTEAASAAVEEEKEETNGAPDGLDGRDDQNGLSDQPGDAGTDRGSGEDPGAEGTTIQGADEADGAEEGKRSESVYDGNKAYFELIDKIKDGIVELQNATTEFGWIYNREKIGRAYRLALNMAADMERLAQKQGWDLYA